MARRPVSRGDSFLKSWPAIARGTGLLIGLAELGVSILLGPEHVSAEVCAFAGGLLVAPNIAGAQSKRNERREE